MNQWLNQAPRPDFVKTTKPTDKDPVSFGCALAFLFYLNSQLNFTINQILSQILGIALGIYATICLTLAYFDLRVRKEAFDLELAARTQSGSAVAEQP